MQNLVRRRGDNAQRNCNGSDCEAHKDQRSDDVQKRQSFGECDDEANVEENKLKISGRYGFNFLKHFYIISIYNQNNYRLTLNS